MPTNPQTPGATPLFKFWIHPYWYIVLQVWDGEYLWYKLSWVKCYVTIFSVLLNISMIFRIFSLIRRLNNFYINTIFEIDMSTLFNYFFFNICFEISSRIDNMIEVQLITFKAVQWRRYNRNMKRESYSIQILLLKTASFSFFLLNDFLSTCVFYTRR